MMCRQPSFVTFRSGDVGIDSWMATSASDRSTSAERIVQDRLIFRCGYARWNSISRGVSQNVPRPSVMAMRTSPASSGAA